MREQVNYISCKLWVIPSYQEQAAVVWESDILHVLPTDKSAAVT